MDRIWQWAWDRYGARYSWAIYVISFLALLPVYFVFVAFEDSGHYVEAAAITVIAVLVVVYVMALPGHSTRCAIRGRRR
jgi:adenylate cyclase